MATSLLDLIQPYFLAGIDLGPVEWIFQSFAGVESSSLSICQDEHATVIAGAVSWNGKAQTWGDGHPDDLLRIHFGPQGLDITDYQVEFRLTAPRIASPSIRDYLVQQTQAHGSGSAASQLRDLFQALGDVPSAPSQTTDYPCFAFRLELLFGTIAVYLPEKHFKPALRAEDGWWGIDWAKAADGVYFELPKVALLVEQDVDFGKLSVSLTSWGASSLHDPLDLSTGELVRMVPTNTIHTSQVFGFGLDHAVLDLSQDKTPPELVEQFGVGNDFQGLWLKEVRFFAQPARTEGLSFEVMGEDLLIDFRQGISGLLAASVVQRVDKSLKVWVRFFDGVGYVPLVRGQIGTVFPGVMGEIEVDGTTVTLNGNTELRLAITGGLPPFAATVTASVKPDPIKAGTPERPYWIITKSMGTLTIKVWDSTTSSGAPVASWTETVIITAGTGSATPLDSTLQAVVTCVPVQSGTTTYQLTASAFQNALSTGSVRVTVPAKATANFNIGNDNTVLVPAGQTLTVTFPTTGTTIHRAGGLGGSALTFNGNLPASNSSSDMRAALAQFDFLYNDAIQHWLKDRKANEVIHVEGHAGPAGAGLPALRAQIAQQELNALGLTNANMILPAIAPDSVVGFVPSDRVDLWFETTAPTATLNATVSIVPVVPDPPLPMPLERHSFLKRLEIKVRLERNKLVLFEVSGEIDFNTALEKQNLIVQNAPLAPGVVNPADGVTDFRLTVMYDTATRRLTEELALTASDNDRDGLLAVGPGTGADIFGALLVLAPVLGESLESAVETKSKDRLAAFVGVSAVAITAALTGAFQTQELILHGIELSSSEMYAGPMRLETLGILFDYSVAFNLNINLPGLTVKATNAQVRYKALGIKASFLTSDNLDFVFDTSKGYRFDLANPSLFAVSGLVGKFLAIFAVRIARRNPVVLEMDLGSNANLGVVTLDRFRLIVEFNEDGSRNTRLIPGGIGINIPGTLIGHGYVNLTPDSTIEGSLDLTLVAFRMRASAKLRIEPIKNPPAGREGARAVIVTIEVNLTTAISIGATGLGLWGFLGLLAIHYRRNENPDDRLPALTWFNDQAKGDPTEISAWTPEMDRFAIGLGAILGTLEGGFILNMKGMILVELPGPRILVVSKIDVLKKRADLDSDPKTITLGGTLGVIDLDFKRRRITIAALSNYQVSGDEPFLSVVVPVEALFQFQNALPKWHAYFGSISSPATATFLSLKVTAYFMLEGYRIENFPGPSGAITLPGFAVAVGIRASFKIGGGKLYFRAASRLDVGVSFAPFLAVGTIELEGELRLFIVSLSAFASLTFQAPHKTVIDGQACAEIKLGFRKLRGCVHFHFEQGSVASAPPIPFLFGVQLQGRSPALIEGQATDAPVDSAIEARKANADLPEVAIDCIPVLQFRCAPATVPSTNLRSVQSLSAPPRALPGGKLDLGAGRSVRFDLQDITVTNLNTGAQEANLPAVWRAATEMIQGQDTSVDLALNATEPTGTPRAFERSDELNGTVARRWGAMCQPVAPPAAVLWTVHHKALGTSPSGWKVVGLAAPDPPDTTRSFPPDTVLRMRGFGGKTSEWETERDRQAGKGWTEPAEILGDLATTGSVISTIPSPVGTPSPLPGGSSPVASATSFAVTRAAVSLPPLSPLPTPIPVTPPIAVQGLPGRVLKLPRPHMPVVASAAAAKPAALVSLPAPELYGVRMESGPVSLVRVLLAAPKEQLVNLFLRAVDDQGVEIARQGVSTSSVVVADFTALKANWPGLPSTWESPLQQALVYLQTRQPTLTCYVVTWQPPRSAALDVFLSTLPGRTDALVLAGAVALLRSSEIDRAAGDQAVRNADRQALATSLSPAKPFLFDPASTYQIDVKYAETLANVPQTDTFFFKTQAVAPKRLQPWILTTAPAAEEPFHFTTDPLHILFNEPVVFDLFQKYGKDLTLELRQGNGDHPSETPPKPGSGLPLAKRSLLTPFEDAVRATFLPDPKFSCFQQALTPQQAGSPARHPDLAWQPVLSRFMPYTLAIIATPLPSVTIGDINTPISTTISGSQATIVGHKATFGGLPILNIPPVTELPSTAIHFNNPPAPEPLYEISFHTSRFESPEELAGVLFDAPPRTRLLTAPLNLLSTSQTDPLLVTDAEMEAILQSAGMESLPPASDPGFTFLWEPSGSTERLSAILVDAPERVFRQRPVPTLQRLSDSNGWVERWVNAPMDVMSLREGSTNLKPGIVRTTGGLRTLVILQPLTLPANPLHLVLRVATPGFFTPDGTDQTRDLDIWKADILRDAPWRRTDG